MKKDKKKGASKKTWIVDCRTDCAFDFALKVLREAENEKYPFVLRANFAKIAYLNSCETIARAQTNPQEFKLEIAFKLFIRNLKRIIDVAEKMYADNLNTAPVLNHPQNIIENPFDYVDIDYHLIEKCFTNAKNHKTKVDDNLVNLFASQYHYPMIYERFVTTKPEFRLLPTNDILLFIPERVKCVFDIAENSSSYYSKGIVGKNNQFINLINLPNLNIPDPLLIHVPEDSFNDISDLIRFAADMPNNVEEICLTAYRLGKDNSMISDIIKASNNKIHCKLYIELSARGEIDKDLEYLKKIINEADHQYLDVKVQYNGIKVHGKMILIKLKMGKSIGVFSTGNYNESTAMVYKDYHYISCEENVTDMIQRNFSILWNSNQPVLSSIANILSKEIYEEISKGKNGRIWIQTNHLDNKHIVTLLKEAIHRGCDVKLIVRTTKGFHSREMKNCKTIVGKYLEHSRVYIFGNGSNTRIYLSSSDILFRNLYNRFESYVKISNVNIQNQLITDFRNLYKNGQK